MSIWNLLAFGLGLICGATAVAAWTIVTDAQRVGRPPRRTTATEDAVRKTDWTLFWQAALVAGLGCAFVPRQWQPTLMAAFYFGYLIVRDLNDIASRHQ